MKHAPYCWLHGFAASFFNWRKGMALLAEFSVRFTIRLMDALGIVRVAPAADSIRLAHEIPDAMSDLC